MIRRLSPVMLSNLYTMYVSSKVDPRQSIPSTPGIPSEDIRLCRAKLIMEEALETVEALGFSVSAEIYQNAPSNQTRTEVRITNIHFHDSYPPNLEEIIDGCCDAIYVCTGTMAACGVPDLPHLEEVCRANNDKFPGGKATVNADGKFLKPVSWQGPNHSAILKEYDVFSLKAFAEYYVTLVPLKQILAQT